MRSMQQLAADHDHILEVLRTLDRVLHDADRTRTVPSEFLRTLVTFSQSFVDLCHHGKEEGCLFPCLERCGMPREGGPIGIMLQEHEKGRALVREIADRLERYEAGRARVDEVLAPCREYVDLLQHHIEKENTILFPMGEHCMGDDDDDATVTCFEEREAELGPGARERLVQLGQALSAATSEPAS
ncbi:MAG TPA: hemerythrin domain-containing protein [bacterium]|nr:hemerythrin domain-containing protein [bacterium]